METILEILKITLPAVIVFFTVHSLWKSYLSAQLQMDRQKTLVATDQDKSRLKIQALERLLMFCERTNPYQMRWRLSTPEMNGRNLAMSMMLAVNQEYEHNVSQQLYVSDTLWKIITTAKNQLVEVIAEASSAIEPGDAQELLILEMDRLFAKISHLPMDKAKLAIKQEYEG